MMKKEIDELEKLSIGAIAAVAHAFVKAYMSTKEAAAYLGISTSYLNKARTTGGPAPRYVRIGRRCLYRKSDLDAFAAGNVHRTTSEYADE